MYMPDSTTLFKLALMLLILYIVSRLVLYLIRQIRGVGRTEMISGTIHFVRAVGRRCVQFQLEGDSRIFEMVSEKNWVLYKKDRVKIAGYRDRTGKFIALAYMNISKSVYGHDNLVQLPWVIIIASIYAMIGIVYIQYYELFPVAIAALLYGLYTIQPDLVVRQSIDLISK